MAMAKAREEWLTLDEAAKLSDRSKETIRNWIKAGYIKPYRKPLDKRLYVRFDELHALLDQEPRPIDGTATQA